MLVNRIVKGSIVALVTPMHADGSIDYAALTSLIELHHQCGTDGVVLLGTTGEAFALTEHEKFSIVEHVLSANRGVMQVIVGANANATQSTIGFCQQLSLLPIDGYLLSSPSYVKPTQLGLIHHFSTIANNVNLPIVIYNVPSRAAVALDLNSVITLSEHNNIVAIKDCDSDAYRIATMVHATSGSNFNILAGDDMAISALIRLGAKGVISVAANFIPAIIKELVSISVTDDYPKALAIQDKIDNLNQKLFVETNPIPVKWLMNHLGMIDNGIRSPLMTLSEEYRDGLLEAYEQTIQQI